MTWMESGEPTELRARIRELLASLPEWPDLDEQQDAAELLVALLAPLGFQAADDPDTVRMAEETAPHLRRIAAGLPSVVARGKAILYDTFLGAEWQELSERRSGLQFLHDLYAGRGVDGVLEGAELDGIDDLLAQRAPAEGYVLEQFVPAGIPPDHWWWSGTPPS